MCLPPALVEGVNAQIRSGRGEGDSLVFGLVGSDASTPTAKGVADSRVLGRSFAPATRQSGYVRAFIQTREYPHLATRQTAALRDAAVLQGVIRTQSAWVDRTLIRISFQLKDDLGSPLVNTLSYGIVELRVTSGMLDITSTCDGMPSGSFYLGYCAITHADAAWFAGDGADANVEIRASLPATQTSISAALGSIQFIGQPAWYSPLLRSPSVTTERDPPPGFNETVGLFITLPSSPVYAGGTPVESFFANVFVDTRGFVANSWRLKIFFNTSILEYVAVEVRSGRTQACCAHARVVVLALHGLQALHGKRLTVPCAGEQHFPRSGGDIVGRRRKLQLRRLSLRHQVHAATEAAGPG